MLFVSPQELSEREKQIQHLECQKCYLGEEIYRITGVEEGFWSDEVLVSTRSGGGLSGRSAVHSAYARPVGYQALLNEMPSAICLMDC